MTLSLNILILTGIFASVCSGSIKTGPSPTNNDIAVPFIEDDKFFYFYDITTRNHSASSDFCKKASASGELAIITGLSIAERIRLGDYPPAGTYWINGREFSDMSKFSNIDVVCEDHRQLWSLDNVPVTVPINYCLALVKGSTPADSRYQAMDCTTAARVLCSLPINACRNPVITTLPPP